MSLRSSHFRKILAVMLCLALLLGSGTSLAAKRDTILKVSDNQPPLIATITIAENGQTLQPGGVVHIAAKVEDSSVISNVYGWLRKPNNNGYVHYNMKYNPATDQYETTYTFKATDTNGVYLFDEIYAQDQYGNYRYLGGSRFGQVSLTGGGAPSETTNIIKELAFIPNGATITAGTRDRLDFHVKLDADPGQFRDVYVDVARVDEDGNWNHSYGFGSDYNETTGYWEGSAYLNDFIVNGKYAVVYVGIETQDGNYNSYSPATQDAYFILTGGVDDETPPVVENVFFAESGRTLGPDSEIHIQVKATDAGTGVDHAYAQFEGPNGREQTDAQYIEYHHSWGTSSDGIYLGYNEATGMLEGTMKLPYDMVNATYYLTYLDVYDKAGNYDYLNLENMYFTFNGPDIISNQIDDFVVRAYNIIFGRDVDPSGRETWGKLLATGGATAAEFINLLLSSDEYTLKKHTSAETVDILYQAMLGRAADESGKAGWAQALDQTGSIATVINGFAGSVEFRGICHPYGIKPGSVNGGGAAPSPDTPRGKIEAFVKRCYQLILNRAADDGGLKGWSDALEGKTAAAAQIIDGFVRSPEYINRKLTNEQSVTILYKTMLDRDPDEAGKAGWVDALSKGYTLQHIINGFCGSAEFTKICSDYGIEAGSVDVPAKASAALEAAAQLEAKKLPDERIGNAVSADDAGITVVNGYEPAEVEAFVKHAYRAALGREADEAGLAGWTEQIVSGAVAPKAFLRTLLGSDEFAARNLSSEAVVETLYRLYLNRGTDDAAADRVAQLAAGGLDEVIKGFEGSAEFRLVLNSFGL